MSLDSDNSVDRLGTFSNGNLLLVMILVNTFMDEWLVFCYVLAMEIIIFVEDIFGARHDLPK
uniref:Transmembrane protein n=1 Tax=Arundo donax TaxID=35708 RepID=A0A0A9HNU3_ARUDO